MNPLQPSTICSTHPLSMLTDIACSPIHQFKCKKSGKCISNNFLCDTMKDCGAGDDSDEENCRKPMRTYYILNSSIHNTSAITAKSIRNQIRVNNSETPN